MGPPLKPEFPALLAGGFHVMTLDMLRRLCVTARDPSLTRPSIMEGLTTLILRLNEAGVRGEVWIDGSFVTFKVDPEDVDILVHAHSSQYDADSAVRMAVEWATSRDR